MVGGSSWEDYLPSAGDLCQIGKGMGTEAKGVDKPPREPRKEEETQVPLTPGRELEIEDVAGISLSPASVSLFDSVEPRHTIVYGGKPQGMMSMIQDVQEEASDGEGTDLNDDASISVNLGRALQGSSLRYQEGDLRRRTFPPATDVPPKQAKTSAFEEPPRARVCRVSSGNPGWRRVIPIDTADLEVMMAGNVRQVKEVSTRSQFQNGLKVSEEVVERTYDVEFNAGFILK